MNEKEFEKQQLEQLLNDLKDIDKYTNFKNGAFIYDLGHYQGLLLVNEIERLHNVINEFTNWLEKESKEVYRDCGYHQKTIKFVLDKWEKLRGDSNE